MSIADRIEIGPFVLTRGKDGMARARLLDEIDPDGTWVWTWPTTRGGDHWTSFAEDWAKAFALIDGRFEVRRFR